MSLPSIKIPFTGPLPPAIITPASASTVAGAIDAITTFFTSSPAGGHKKKEKTVVLTGAGISVESGLSDYRGENGTYIRNKSYRPIFFHEFLRRHESRQRYWARSFFGWPVLEKARPNEMHLAIGTLGEKGYVSSVITQNVDSFHAMAHPELPTVELHGYLRSVVCTTCRNRFPRDEFQRALARLNPSWTQYLREMLESGALDTYDRTEQQRKGLKMNADGDVDLAQAPYSTFRYPACPTCLEDGTRALVQVDGDGAWLPSSADAGILKPAVVMFGENVDPMVKLAAEEAVDAADKVLVVGSSLATYSAWRLVEKAHKRGMPIAVINVGGVRNESVLFDPPRQRTNLQVRCSLKSEWILPVVSQLLDRTVP